MYSWNGWYVLSLSSKGKMGTGFVYNKDFSEFVVYWIISVVSKLTEENKLFLETKCLTVSDGQSLGGKCSCLHGEPLCIG